MPPRQKKTTEAEIAGNCPHFSQLSSSALTTRPAPSQTPIRSRRARRAPTAPDKTPPPPATPPPPRRRRRQPAPPTEPAPAPAEGPTVELDPVGADDAPPRTRNVFDDDPDAGAAGSSPRASVRFTGLHDDDDGEEFREPSPSTSSRSRSPSPHPSACFAPPPTAKIASSRAACITITRPAQKTYRQIWGGQRRLDFFRSKGSTGQTEAGVLILQQHATDAHIGMTKFAKLTSTGVLRKHLYEHHIDVWVEGCDQLKIPIKAKEAARFVDAYRVRKHQKTGNTSNSEPGRREDLFRRRRFVDAIVEFIVGDDQSINVVENEQLRAIFLMLRAELKDSDIPHRTKIRKRVIEIWDEHLILCRRRWRVQLA
ncbi:hypothetical protein B0H14DRAFT_3141636 [Mycena olivaceomarginata]|nr:hypothetical protein B0H14DRAFT_3141636 [Mycena olivaceomarginata]